MPDVPAEPEEVDAVGNEPELEPADDDERPEEKSGNPVDADEELCCRPPLAEGMDGMPPLDEEEEDDGIEGIEDELDDLDAELDDELDELDDDGMDGIEDDDGIEGDGILLDCEVCVVVSHALNNRAVRPMPSINRCCDIFIFINSACAWQDDDFALIRDNMLIRPLPAVIIAPQSRHFQSLLLLPQTRQ